MAHKSMPTSSVENSALVLSCGLSLSMTEPSYVTSRLRRPGANVIKLFTAIIYHHSMVIPSFCVIKQHYLGNYCRMAVNYDRNIYNIEFTLEWQ
jgi:hypothetical protein